MNTKTMKPSTFNTSNITSSAEKHKSKYSLSYVDRLNEGENASDLINELMDTFQSRKIQTERSLMYFLEKCIEDENIVRDIRLQFNPKNKYSVKPGTVTTILVKIEKLKKKFEDELRRSCITKEEYGKRVRVTLELIGEYNNYKNSVEILEHIFLENTD